MAVDRSLFEIQKLREAMESKEPDYKKVIKIYFDNRENENFQNHAGNLPVEFHLTTIIENAVKAKIELPQEQIAQLESIKEKQKKRLLEKEFDSAKKSLEEAIETNDINAIVAVYHKFRENSQFQEYVVDNVMSIPHQFHLDQLFKNQEQLSEASKAYLPKLEAINKKQTEKFQSLYKAFKGFLNDAERELGEMKTETLFDESIMYSVEKRFSATNLSQLIAKIKDGLSEGNVVERATELQQFFEARFTLINDTDLVYLYAQYDASKDPTPQNAFTRACISAGHSVRVILNKSIHEALFPTLDRDAMHAYLNITLGERLKSSKLQFHSYILSDDGKRIIEAYDCLSTAAKEGKFEHTILVDGKPQLLSEQESKRVKYHSQASKEYWEASQAILRLKNPKCDFVVMKAPPDEDTEFKGLNNVLVLVQPIPGRAPTEVYFVDRTVISAPLVSPPMEEKLAQSVVPKLVAKLYPSVKDHRYLDIQPLSDEQLQQATEITGLKVNTPGSRLQALCDGLEAGNYKHQGQEFDSGAAANVAIASFGKYWKTLTEPEQNELSSLRDASGRFTFLEVWGALSRPKSADYKDVTFCIKLIGDMLAPIIDAHPELFVNTLELEKRQRVQEDARKKLEAANEGVALHVNPGYGAEGRLKLAERLARMKAEEKNAATTALAFCLSTCPVERWIDEKSLASSGIARDRKEQERGSLLSLSELKQFITTPTDLGVLLFNLQGPNLEAFQRIYVPHFKKLLKTSQDLYDFLNGLRLEHVPRELKTASVALSDSSRAIKDIFISAAKDNIDFLNAILKNNILMQMLYQELVTPVDWVQFLQATKKYSNVFAWLTTKVPITLIKEVYPKVMTSAQDLVAVCMEMPKLYQQESRAQEQITALVNNYQGNFLLELVNNNQVSRIRDIVSVYPGLIRSHETLFDAKQLDNFLDISNKKSLYEFLEYCLKEKPNLMLYQFGTDDQDDLKKLSKLLTTLINDQKYELAEVLLKLRRRILITTQHLEKLLEEKEPSTNLFNWIFKNKEALLREKLPSDRWLLDVAFEKGRFTFIDYLLTTHINAINAAAIIQFKNSILSADSAYLPETEKERWSIELLKYFIAKMDVSQAEDILTRYPKMQSVAISISADVLKNAAQNSNLKFADYVFDRKDLMSAYNKDELGAVLSEFVKNTRLDYAAKLLHIRSDISLNDPIKIESTALAKYKDVILSADDKALPEVQKERLIVELFEHYIARPDLMQAEDILERYKKIQSISISIPIEALRLAAKSNHKFVGYVLDRKDLMSTYKKEELGTVLAEFVQHGRFDYVDKLLNIRADIDLNAPLSGTGLTPLAIICEQKSTDASFNFLKKLCSEVKDIADVVKDKTPLYRAAENKDLTVFNYFISTPDIFNKFTLRSKVFALSALIMQGQDYLKAANDYWNQLAGTLNYPEPVKSALFAFIANQKFDDNESIEKIEKILKGEIGTTFKENESFLTFITKNRRSALEFVLKDNKLLKSFSTNQLGQFLVSLVQQQLIPEVKKLLDQNLNITADWLKAADLPKALMTAVAENNIEQVKNLLSESILSLCTERQLTELYLFLIKNRHLAETAFLAKSDFLKKINLCQKDEKTGNTILHLLKEQPEILNQFSDFQLYQVFHKLMMDQKYELASLLVTVKPDLVKMLESASAEEKFYPLYYMLGRSSSPDLKLVQAIAEKSNHFLRGRDNPIIRALEKEHNDVIPIFINNPNILAKYDDEDLAVVFKWLVEYNMLDLAKKVLESRQTRVFVEKTFWQASKLVQGKPFFDNFLNNKSLIASFSLKVIDGAMDELIKSGQYDQAEKLLSMRPDLPPSKLYFALDEVVKMPNPSKAILDYLFINNGNVGSRSLRPFKHSDISYSLLTCAAIYKSKNVLNWVINDDTNIFNLQDGEKNIGVCLIYLITEKEYDLAFRLLEKLFKLIGPLNKSTDRDKLKLFSKNVEQLCDSYFNGCTVISTLLQKQPDNEESIPAYRRLLEAFFKDRYEREKGESKAEPRSIYVRDRDIYVKLVEASKNKNFDFLEMYLRYYPYDITATIEALMLATDGSHQIHLENIAKLVNVLQKANIRVQISHKTIDYAFRNFEEDFIKNIVHENNYLKDDKDESRFLQAIDTINTKVILFFMNNNDLIKKMSQEDLGKALYKFATKQPPWTTWIIDLLNKLPEDYDVLKLEYMEKPDRILWLLLQEPSTPQELILRCCRRSEAFQKETLDLLLKTRNYEAIAIVVSRYSQVPSGKLDRATLAVNRELASTAMKEFLGKDEHLGSPLAMRVSFLNNITTALLPEDAPLIQARLIPFLTRTGARDEKDEKKSAAAISPYSDLSCLRNLGKAFQQPKDFRVIVKLCLTEIINQSQSQTDLLAMINYLRRDIKSFPFYTTTKGMWSHEWGRNTQMYVTGEMLKIIKAVKEKLLTLAKKDKNGFAPGVQEFLVEPVGEHADYSKKERYLKAVEKISSRNQQKTSPRKLQ